MFCVYVDEKIGKCIKIDIGGLLQDCSNSTDNALELLQSYAEPSICKGSVFRFFCRVFLLVDIVHIDGLVHDCSNSSPLAME